MHIRSIKVQKNVSRTHIFIFNSSECLCLLWIGVVKGVTDCADKKMTYILQLQLMYMLQTLVYRRRN